MKVKDADLLLPGFGFSGFRSFRTMQYLSGLSKVSFLAGRNNVGKSNVLRFVTDVASGSLSVLDWLDEPLPSGDGLKLAVEMSESRVTPESMSGLGNNLAELIVDAVFSLECFHPDEVPGGFWLPYSARTQVRTYGGSISREWTLDEEFLKSVDEAAGHAARQAVQAASQALAGEASGRFAPNLERVLNKLFPFKWPETTAVSAFRRIGESEDEGHSGLGLIKRLAALQNPGPRNQGDRRKFEAINTFAREVLDDPSVTIEIPATQDQILVHQGDRTLPLDSLGTGVHQTIIIAAEATVTTGHLVCIEEPEIHLHPIMQRRLVRYLAKATDNQYLIATHSAHMLDFEEASVLHLRPTSHGTAVTSARTAQSLSDICSDLGYRPSDLLQTNAVLWVEGPSDRIYLRFWLDRCTSDDPLVEGVHYSIIFYGGRLLRHLSAEDPTVNEFISLRRLNRHSAILIDSDMSGPDGHINETKRRIEEEFNSPGAPGFAWITDGRTIENYVPISLLEQAVHEVHPQIAEKNPYRPPATKWNEPLDIRPSAPDKVKIAHTVISNWVEDLEPALEREVEKAVDFVRDANRGFRAGD